LRAIQSETYAGDRQAGKSEKPLEIGTAAYSQMVGYVFALNAIL
jgi:hypothetical protein